MKVFLIAQVESKVNEETGKVIKTYKSQAFIEAPTAQQAIAKFEDTTKGLGQTLGTDYEVKFLKNVDGIISEAKTEQLIFAKVMNTGKVYLFPVESASDVKKAAFQDKNDVVSIAPQEITNLVGEDNKGYLI